MRKIWFFCRQLSHIVFKISIRRIFFSKRHDKTQTNYKTNDANEIFVLNPSIIRKLNPFHLLRVAVWRVLEPGISELPR